MLVMESVGGNMITQGVGVNRLKREEKTNAEDTTLGPAVV